MDKIVLQIWNTGMIAAWMVLAVIFVRQMLGKWRAPAGLRLILWGLVAIRLILPFSIESRFSLVPDMQRFTAVLEDVIEGRRLGMTEAFSVDATHGREEFWSNPSGQGDGAEWHNPSGQGDGAEWHNPSGQGDGAAWSNPAGQGDGAEWHNPSGQGDGAAWSNPAGQGDGDARQNPAAQGDSATWQNSMEQENGAAQPTSPAWMDGSLTQTQIQTQMQAAQGNGAVQPNPAASLWVAGILLMLLYTVFSSAYLRKRLAVCMPYDNLNDRMEDASLQSGIAGSDKHNSCRIYISEGIAVPFLAGIFRPAIYLPVGLTKQEYALVLAHEKAHLKNLDHLWKPLGFFLLSIYWFHPLLWVAYFLFCRDLELACDERVIRGMDMQNRKSYMETLLKCSIRGRRHAAYPLAFGEVGVKERMKAIRGYRRPAVWIGVAGVAICAVLAVTMLTDPKEDGTGILKQEQEETGVAKQFEPWAEAVLQRDWEVLQAHSTPEVYEQLRNTLSTSPWPMPDRTEAYSAYQIAIMGDNQLQINYYVYDNAPIVCVRTESLRWEEKGKGKEKDFQVTNETMTRQDKISDGESFAKAYLFGVNRTALDYMENGLGEQLLERYKRHDSAYFETLGNPTAAAYTLLHLDKEAVKVVTEANIDVAVCSVLLPEYAADGSPNGHTERYLQMVRLGGYGGIWIPQNEDTKAFEENEFAEVMRVIRRDLNGDGAEEELTLFYDNSYETAGGALRSSYEERVSKYIGQVVARVTDGATGEVLFQQTYGLSHQVNGVLGLVEKDGKSCLFTGSCYEIMDVADYEVKVYSYENGLTVIDSYQGTFPTSSDEVVRGVLRERQQGETYAFQNSTDVIPALQEIVSRYEQGSELLVACDVMVNTDYANTPQNVFLGVQEKQYTLEDYYRIVEDRHRTTYSVRFPEENLYGRACFCVESRETNLFPNIINFYDADTGKRLAELWGNPWDEEAYELRDLDQDGKNELVGSVMWGDGVMDTFVYREEAGKILRGEGSSLMPGVEDRQLPGIGMLSSKYLPDTGKIRVKCWNAETGTFDIEEYEIDMDKMKFWEYNG